MIRELAARGDSLVLGQGGQALAAGHAGRVPRAVRRADGRASGKRGAVAQPEGSGRAAIGASARRGRGKDYLARYHNVRWLDPLLYDLVINTQRVPSDVAIGLVVVQRGGRGKG